MSVTQEELEKLAKLARLELDAKEKQELTISLDRMVGYMNKLRELDLASVEPMMRVDDSPRPLRPDLVRPGLSREDALRNAPAVNRDHFSIPKVIG